VSTSFDRYCSLFFLVIGIGFVFESTRISESAYGSNVGPNIFPMGLGILLMLLSLRLFYETFRYPKKSDNTPSGLDYKRFLIIVLSAVLYGLLLETLGYVVTTFAFLLVGFQVINPGGLWKSVLISGVFSFGVYYLFVEVLQGSLPGFPIW
jgi:putative tricarboxylic transport membrane protein